MGQDDLSQEELTSVIAERQAELQQLMERAASGTAPEEKSKCYNHLKTIYDSIPSRGQTLSSRWGDLLTRGPVSPASPSHFQGAF